MSPLKAFYRRYVQIGFIRDFDENDLYADFQAIYNLDMYTLEPARFIALASRIYYYETGIIHRKLVKQQQKRTQHIPGAKPGEEVRVISDDSPELMKLLGATTV